MARSLSSSDLRRLAAELAAVADGCTERGVDQAEVSELLATTTRLFTACSPDPYGPASLAALSVTPTEACTVAAALLRSQSLTPFEFSIWFSGGRVGGGR